MKTSTPLLVCLIACSGAAQQAHVVPASFALADAVAFGWLPGASRALRQQTLVGANHLTARVGQTLTAIEFRRSAANEHYQGGVTSLTVTVSTAPHPPLQASNAFAANTGASATQVFSGLVTIPASPPDVGPNVAWSAANIVRVPLVTPFQYTGGPLCIDIVGTPVSGMNANWWMADAMFEDISGSATNLGGGCGAYGGPSHEWSNVASRSLLPGAFARFFAYGPPMSIGIVAFGSRAPAPIPLSMLGLGSAPGCEIMLGSLDVLMAAVFEPEANTSLLARGGIAEVRFKIPATPAVFGVTMTTQWLEWSQMATSNAIEWSVASQIPTLDMALLEGHPQEATGELTVHLAHVIRLEWQ
jgi:hypothetical protein